MAALMQLQAGLLASPAGHLAKSSRRMGMASPMGRVPRFRKQSFRVTCMADEADVEVEDKSKSTSTSPKSSSEDKLKNNSTTSKSIRAESNKKESTSFKDLFAFSGPAPERINGRLAMVGLMTALGVELSKGKDLFAQIKDGGALWFLAASIVLSVASVVPLLKGEKPEDGDDDAWLNSDAELWNGRLAMLGLLTLALIEYVKGGALI